MQKNKNSIKKYIILLVVLLIAYYVVTVFPFDKNRSHTRDEIVSENIKSLDKTTNELRDLVGQDKESINDLFFNQKTGEKIRGLITTYATDRELKINDNLKLILQQEGNPVRIRYKRAEFELINSRFNLTEQTKDNVTVTNDVIVVKNPNGVNNFELIHDLKTYMVDAYGSKALDRFLDDEIASTIKENQELIDKIGPKK